jgi:hypothetical protein
MNGGGRGAAADDEAYGLTGDFGVDGGDAFLYCAGVPSSAAAVSFSHAS